MPLAAETASAVDDQVARFIDALMTERRALDRVQVEARQCLRARPEEISNAAGLMQGRFLQRNFVGAEETPAYKAIGEIRGHARRR